jgi:hypothetical protein
MSYNGQLNFGLVGDYDELGDLEVLADELRGAIEELVSAAGVGGHNGAAAAGESRSGALPTRE